MSKCTPIRRPSPATGLMLQKQNVPTLGERLVADVEHKDIAGLGAVGRVSHLLEPVAAGAEVLRAVLDEFQLLTPEASLMQGAPCPSLSCVSRRYAQQRAPDIRVARVSLFAAQALTRYSRRRSRDPWPKAGRSRTSLSSCGWHRRHFTWTSTATSSVLPRNLRGLRPGDETGPARGIFQGAARRVRLGIEGSSQGIRRTE